MFGRATITLGIGPHSCVNLECRSEICCARLAGNAGPKKSPSGHHRATLSGYIFATKAYINNPKKTINQQYLPHTSSQYGELRPTSGWDRFVSLGHPYKFQRVSRLGSVTARYSSSGRQPNFAALMRGRHLYLAGRPSRWALAHILIFHNIWTALSWVFFRNQSYNPHLVFISFYLRLGIIQLQTRLVCKLISAPPQPYHKIPDIYLLYVKGGEPYLAICHSNI